MTPAQIAHIMVLVTDYAAAVRGQLNFEQVEAAYAKYKAVEAALRDAPQQAEGWVMVPKAFMSGFYTLAHNWSLEAIPPDYMWGTEGDVFKSTYRQCGHELAKLKDLLAARPSAPTAVEPDERDLFAARWQQLEHMYSKGATANTLGYYIGRPERLDYAAQLRSEHDAARASKGTP